MAWPQHRTARTTGSTARAGAEKAARLLQTTLLVLVAVAVVYAVTRLTAETDRQTQVEEGRKLVQTGDFPRAEATWRSVLREDPENAAALELLSRLYLDTHRYAEALDPLTRLSRVNPEVPNLFAEISECLSRTGTQDEALRKAERQIEENPDDIGALAIAAKILTQKDDERRELEYKRRLVKLRPNHPDFLVMLGRTLVHDHFYAEAGPIVDRLIKADPQNPEGVGLRGQITFYTDSSPDGLSRARADFERTLQLSPTAVPPHLFLGRIATRMGHAPEAVTELTQAKSMAPDREDVYFALAEAYDLAGDHRNAEATRSDFTRRRSERDIEKALEKRCALRPDDFADFLKLGRIKLRRHEVDDAGFYLQRAAELRPADPGARAAIAELSAAAQGT